MHWLGERRTSMMNSRSWRTSRLYSDLAVDLAFVAEDELECDVEVVKDEDTGDAISDVSVFDVPPRMYPLRVVIAGECSGLFLEVVSGVCISRFCGNCLEALKSTFENIQT